LQGNPQVLDGLSFEQKFPVELDSGSSFWAALVSPAESRRLEIVPRAMRLIDFIGRKVSPLFRFRRYSKSPILTPAITFFPVVNTLRPDGFPEYVLQLAPT
jgi:hypothetical protein